MEGAVHRLELILVLLHLHLVEHRLCVKVVMAARLPEVDVGNVRRVQQLVAVGGVLLLPRVLDEAADARALGVPEDKTAARRLLDREQVQLLPQNAVVALLRLLQAPAVLLELPGLWEGGAVDARERLALLVAAPVRPSHALQRHRLGVQLASRLDVRARAEVPPLVTNRVDGDGVVLDAVQDLELEALADGLDAPPRLVARHLLAHDGVILLDD
mmetsp:Transcript_16800/g.56766  ORF Transcript_16800/g.56766 Transcript_16800/m.56766 type:complete len:215 (+) Transcript_16800:1027-1671(+)